MASYNLEWQCLYCGKTIRRISNNPNMPTPFTSNDCPANPANKPGKKGPHFMVKK